MPNVRDQEIPEGSGMGVALLLGEIKGQLRELVHSANNVQMSLNALGQRVAALEAQENRREGASSLWMTVLKSPAVGWLVGAAITVWALLSGKVHP